MTPWLLSVCLLVAETPANLPCPPQDQGLPYTRSARSAALAKIGGHVVVCAGSRYAWVHGLKVRLDEADLLHGEALPRGGTVYVPQAFAGVVALRQFQAAPAPEYLADRWVSTLVHPRLPLDRRVRRLTIDGREYVAAADVARAAGLTVSEHPRGLVCAGATKLEFGPDEAALLDTVISQFDTPEKFADPGIAARYIPSCARQGVWTDHVKVTPAQLARLDGPETKFATAPREQYDLTGFDASLLGSTVPPPGVYPRILFSEADLPLFATRLRQSQLGQRALLELESCLRRSFWNAATSDGKVFAKLASGDLAGLEWDAPAGASPVQVNHQFKGQQPGIFSSHIAYLPEALCTMALYCLLTGDDEHGRQCAAAIANYYRLREPLIDAWNAISDSEFGSTRTQPDGTVWAFNGTGSGATTWRGMHGIVGHMNLGLCLDFGGKWMTVAQRDLLRRVIAKATCGKRAYGQDAPPRFRDVNWVTWDLPQYLAVLAIEGLEGCDPEVLQANRDTVRAFCDWGIDEQGVVFESNGKTPGGLQFQLLSMIALARRGENLFGHPHFRRLLTGQLQMTSPTGRVVVNSGTAYWPWSQQLLSFQYLDELKAFFPGDKRADYLLSQSHNFPVDDEGFRMFRVDGPTPDAYRGQVGKVTRLRMPSPTYPGFVLNPLYATDYPQTTRDEVGLPLDFSAPGQGIFASRSSNSPNAAWLCLQVRPNHYLGAGHHHADAGLFCFSAFGVDWLTESAFSQSYDGPYHNQVLVDGRSEAQPEPGVANGYQGAAKYLGMTSGEHGALASADLTYAYSWRWLTQPPQVWEPALAAQGWEADPSPELARIFAGTARYKLRPWWSSYGWGNYLATSRAPFNPMRYVFRTCALVRGPRPYALVVDDLRKDDEPHRYEWTACLNGGVWQAAVPCGAGQLVLAWRKYDRQVVHAPLKPEPGEPLLLVTSLGGGQPRVETVPGPVDRQGKPQTYDRLCIPLTAVEARYRVLLTPFKAGEPLPTVTDTLDFVVGADQRTWLTARRGGRTLVSATARPLPPS